MSSHSSSRVELPAAILASGWQCLLAITGGGSRAISALLETPGASRCVLGAVVPYAAAALADVLGGVPEQACSEPTGRLLALAAHRLARNVGGRENLDRLIGVGCTASLVSDRPKRGEHRIYVATHSARATASLALTLDKGRRNRIDEDSLAAEVILCALAAGVGIARLDNLSAALELATGEQVTIDRVDADPAVAELVAGVRRKVVLPAGVATVSQLDEANAELPRAVAIFPGAFNPPHAGHLRMAVLAEQRLGVPLAWELSVANVDKPQLDYIAMRDRVAALAAQHLPRPITLTRAPTFREKAALFPGATFVVGADTIARIADPKYYHDAGHRDAAIREIAGHGCRFLAFGREQGGQFQSLADLDLPAELRQLCDGVPPAEFREDISSTQLRGRGGV